MEMPQSGKRMPVEIVQVHKIMATTEKMDME